MAVDVEGVREVEVVVEAEVEEEADGSGFVRTSSPLWMTAVKPKRRAKRRSRSSCPEMEPCGLEASAMRVVIWAQVMVSRRERSWRGV